MSCAFAIVLGLVIFKRWCCQRVQNKAKWKVNDFWMKDHVAFTFNFCVRFFYMAFFDIFLCACLNMYSVVVEGRDT